MTLVNAKLTGPTAQIMGTDTDPSRLPRRELPHGNVATLYLMFLAFCRSLGEGAASKSVFYRVASRWRECLRFHKQTVHSMCGTCSALRAAIRNATDPFPHKLCLTNFDFEFRGANTRRNHNLWQICLCEDFREHAKLCDRLLGHYTLQWRDREIYWQTRDRARAFGDVVSLILDSYDKAKVCLPKFPFGRSPKKPIYDQLRSGLSSDPGNFVFPFRLPHTNARAHFDCWTQR